jgi:hypothetical protein
MAVDTVACAAPLFRGMTTQGFSFAVDLDDVTVTNDGGLAIYLGLFADGERRVVNARVEPTSKRRPPTATFPHLYDGGESLGDAELDQIIRSSASQVERILRGAALFARLMPPARRA